MKIAIFCVNYHSYDSLRNYIDSIELSVLATSPKVDVELYVADNSCPSEQFNYTPKGFSMQIVPTGKNLGYFGAIRLLMKKFPPTKFDYSIISNVDVLLEKNTLSELAQTKHDPSVGWIAPTIFSKSMQSDWNPQAIERYSIQKLKSLRFLFKHPWLLKLKQRLFHTYHFIKNCPSGSVYAGHGSFIILTKTFFQLCGIVNYPIFLYGEEIYLAELCRLHELRVIYSPQIRIIDIGRVSTKKISLHQFCKYNYEAINYIIHNFYK